MQRLVILKDKLRFISWFFGLTIAPFAGIKRKIETERHAYELSMNSEDSSEPPFALEWLDASEAIRLQGQLCLSLIQRSLREYLDETVRLSSVRPPSAKGNWFRNYQKWFFELGVDWADSGANLLLIEEMTIARNCIQHGSSGDSHSLIKRQNEDYHKRFPLARFKDDLEAKIFRNVGPRHRSIDLTKEKMSESIDEITKFGTFIEASVPPAAIR